MSRRERRVGVVEWAESGIVLPPGTPRPGRLKLQSWQRGVLDSFDDAGVRQVTMMLSAQIGKSLLALVIVGYHIARRPVPIMIATPGIDTTKRWIVEKLEPLVESSKEVHDRVVRTRYDKMSHTGVEFAGGHLFFAHSGSMASMRGLTAPLVIADELDAFRASLDVSNPVDMLRQRGAAYRSRKLVLLSTPTTKDSSLIEAQYKRGSASRWFVVCEACGADYTFAWEQVRGGKMYCPSCGGHIDEDMRGRMVESGEWRGTNAKPQAGHVSFHINQLYSHWRTIEETAADYDPNAPRGFMTQVLAEPYRELALEPIPADVVLGLFTPSPETEPDCVTASVDVQGTWLEWQVMEWRGLECRVIRHDKVGMDRYATQRRDELWEDLWPRLADALGEYTIDALFVDAGYKTTEVRHMSHLYLSAYLDADCLRLVRGSTASDEATTGDIIRSEGPKGREFDMMLGVGPAKVWLHRAMSEGHITFQSGAVPEDAWGHPQPFVDSLLSEELELVVSRSGREVERWRKKRARNEALDCAAYNVAARYWLGEDYVRGEELDASDWLALVREIRGGPRQGT